VVRGGAVEDTPGDPRRYFAFKQSLDEAQAAMGRGDMDAAMAAFGDFEVEPMPIDRACWLQLTAIELGLSLTCPGRSR